MPVPSEFILSRELLSPTSTTGQTSRVLLADVIPWINKASVALYIAHIMPCIMHATTDLKFGSYNVLSSLSPVIEASKLVPVEVESLSSVIEMPASICILTNFYHRHH